MDKHINVKKQDEGELIDLGDKNNEFISNTKNEIKEEVIEIIEIPEKHHYQIEIEEFLDSRIISQQKAKEAISKAIISRILSFRQRKGPIACLFFAGPTGVGKTEIVKALAELLLGNENNYTKISCENFMESHTSTTLFGAPKSYTGYGDPSPLEHKNITKYYDSAKRMNQLHDMVRYLDGFNIVLFDEVEKAHYNVKQSLLGLMDTAKVEFTNGKISRFDNSIIIFTSNIGQHEIINGSNSIGFVDSNNFDEKANSKIIQKSMKRDFSPEFRARLTAVIEFEYLTTEDCKKILDNDITDMKNAIKKIYPHNNINLSIDENGVNHILNKGYSKERGAREFLGTISNEIENELNKLLADEDFENYIIKNKNINLYISYQNNKIKIGKSNYGKNDDNNENNEVMSLFKNSNNTGLNGKLKELNFLFGEISQYIELYYLNMEGDIDFREEISVMEVQLKSYGFTRQDILQMRNRAYIEELEEMNFITTFEGIDVFGDNKNIFHPYSQNIVLKIVKKYIENDIKHIKSKKFKSIIIRKIMPVIEKILKVNELSPLQVKELIIYIRKVITDITI
ncbi:MAG: AAA family ATPase [Candidatus Gracilibacteria bacterium]|nr:AAA family ATPase [Candidatus Gracilibacteria bacterium]